MNIISYVYTFSMGVLLTVLIGLQFRPMILRDREQAILRAPLLIYSFYYFLYWVFGTFYVLSDAQYLMLPSATAAIPYSMLIVTLSYLSFLCGYYIFMPAGVQAPVKLNLTLSYHSAVIASYILLWSLRLYLMKLGLYHKTAFVENLPNVSLPPMINIFYQIMTTLPFLFIVYSVIYLKRFYWIVFVLEVINFIFVGWKSGILMAVFFGTIAALLFNKFPAGKYLFRLRYLSVAALLLVLMYVSLFISPFIVSRGLLLSENYIQEFVEKIPDFVQYVIHNEGSEASDKEYTHTRLAAINPLSAVVYQSVYQDKTLLYGELWVDSMRQLLPRVLAKDKPERYGDDFEEQGALRHFDLPDYDTVGTIPLSGYANFGLAGSIFGMFVYGMCIALVWRLVLFSFSRQNMFLHFNGSFVLAFMLMRMLLLEQTFITSLFFNARNLIFILLFINGMVLVFKVFTLEIVRKHKILMWPDNR
jgi:hypothetical protein